MAQQLAGRAVLQIAHHLDAIKDYDQVAVMEAGAVVESGRPHDLLGQSHSKFAALYASSHIV